MKKWFLKQLHNFNMFIAWEGRSGYFEKIGPPGRPSNQDVQLYYSKLSECKPYPKRILILGATPELRKIAAQFSRDVTIVDFSPGILKKTALLVPKEIREHERIIIMNWLAMDRVFPLQSFDAILGDMVIRQVAHFEIPKFLKMLKNMLASNGTLLMRVNVRNPLWTEIPREKIVIDCVKQYEEYGFAGFLSTMMFRLYDKYADKTYSVDQRGVRNALFAAHDAAEGRTKTYIKSLFGTLGKQKARWTHLPREKFEALALKDFTISNIIFADDYPDAEFYPFYVLLPQT